MGLFCSALTWAEIEWMATATPLPLVLKGISSPADAALAAAAPGVAGIVSRLTALPASRSPPASRMRSHHRCAVLVAEWAAGCGPDNGPFLGLSLPSPDLLLTSSLHFLGCWGQVISNPGGRNLDGAIGTADALAQSAAPTAPTAAIQLHVAAPSIRLSDSRRCARAVRRVLETEPGARCAAITPCSIGTLVRSHVCASIRLSAARFWSTAGSAVESMCAPTAVAVPCTTIAFCAVF